MDVVIRSVEEADHEAVHAILTSHHVLLGTMRVPNAALTTTRDRLAHQQGTYRLVALLDDRVVGFGELITYPQHPRHAHTGEVNLVATSADVAGKGVGRALMEEMIDMADNWMRLERLGLIVFTDNTHAVRLYEQLGFEHEGTMRRFGYGDGTWMDAHMMGRLRPS